ncbi:PKD-like family lipoprotein [Sphingobacterium gobiense]|uniref:PKD-like family protein n=1 Tax=Sphingobacterium gobiense TaxID=1382456 RepID=A0A2S9JRU1_9SPHI|nr:PKD-like family lipoprotein [Sphingobacterium gobiense]PRD55989.1 hypothetical protein C5749_01465 [Sphingobacterium gobiense]
MKLLFYFIAVLSFLAIASCSKDLGNYEYSAINELTILDVESEYILRTGIDTLHIQPDIEATKHNEDTGDYSYLWILKREGRTVRDTIGRERNLDYAVRLEPGEFDLYYRVIDNKTGVTWIANIRLIVSTAYSKGLLIIGEDEQGFAEAEMLAMLTDTVHIKRILSTSGLPLLKDPISLVHTGGDANFRKLWAFTKSGSYYLDRSTMTATASNNFSRLLYISETIDPETLHPVVVAPQIRSAAGAIGSSLYRAMVTLGGDVFAGAPIISGGDFFNNPINRLASAPQVRIPAAPYLLYPIGSMNSIMWYDMQNQRFLNYTGIAIATSSTVLPDDGGPFPWNQPAGRTLVYAENTRNNDGASTNGNSFAIMKDADNTHHVYKFYANGTNPRKHAAYTVKPIATDFDRADFYAFSSNRSVIFYSVKNKLYAYDYNPGFEKIYSYPELSTDEITMLKFDTQIDHLLNSLYIATYNSERKGTLSRFLVGTNPNVVELLRQENSTWTDMIKVKDINWRAVN